MAVMGSTLAHVEIVSMQWVYAPRASIAKITSGFHDWVTEDDNVINRNKDH